jgi:NTE family protein
MAGRALVLGGGGVTGVAWELGLLAGLVEEGVDITHPDVLVGTSAGAAVAGIIAGGLLRERYEAQLQGPGDEIPERLGLGLLARWGWHMVRSHTLEQFGARIGAMALATPTIPAARRKAVFESRIGLGVGWPDDIELKVTAVDAETGKFVVFDRSSGVPLIDAVVASCAVPGVWPPAEVAGRRYIDGGMRSAVNADLVSGAERVIIIAPIIRGGGLLGAPRQAGGGIASRRHTGRAREPGCQGAQGDRHQRARPGPPQARRRGRFRSGKGRSRRHQGVVGLALSPTRTASR